jgi:RNA polymerase sigma factor (TIGR02999 family)
MDPRPDITRLVQRWSAGESGALDELVEAVYDDLKRIAHHHVRQSGASGTINTTALVHEAYLKLASLDEGAWTSRAHFFAFCSTAMRRILIDFARRRLAAKRGGEGCGSL